MEADTTSIRQESANWFDLAEDLQRALADLSFKAADTVKAPVWDPKAVAVRVLLRCRGNLQGVILMTERGMAAEGRALVRMMVEASFALAALVESPDEYVGQLKDDFEASRKRQANFILEKIMGEDAPERATLQAVRDSMGKTKLLTQRDLAASGSLERTYLLYQRLSDDASHVSARSLHRHVKKVDGKGWCYQIGPASVSENVATLHSAVLTGIGVGIAITQMLNLTSENRELAQIAERFQSMPGTVAPI